MTEDKLDVRTSDGVADATLVRPDGTNPGVIVLTDIWAVRPAYIDLAKRIAEQGYAVLLPNIFYRSGKPPFFQNFDFQDPKTKARAGEITAPLTPDAMARDGAAYVDGFCLANATKGAAAPSGPGPTSGSMSTLAPGQSTSIPLALPTGATTLSVLTQSTGDSARTLIVDPLGTVVGALTAPALGISTVDLPSPALGIYTIQTINNGSSSVDVLTLATPQVQR